MGKFAKSKLKLLNMSPKGKKIETKLVGKITKKKTAVKDPASEKKKVAIIKNLAKSLVSEDKQKPPQPKQKPVEKQKKRQKTQIDDTKMLLKLMKKK